MKIVSLFGCGVVGCCVVLSLGCQKKTDTVTPVPEEISVSNSVVPEVTMAPDPNETLVSVNGKTLTRGAAMAMARENAARRGVPPQMLDAFIAQAGPQMERQSVDQFVNQTVLEGEAEKLQIPISEQEIDGVVSNLTKGLPPGMTIDQALSQQGMTMDGLRGDIRTNERLRKLYESKTASVQPATDEQVQSFYRDNADQFKVEEQVEASHILLACDEKADAAAHEKAKAEAEAIRKQLVEGADFAELAKAHSSCPSKEKGGALGSFGRGSMVPEFEAAAFGLKPGEISPVVKTSFGYHVIRVTGKKEAGVRSMEDAAEEIRGHLTSQGKEKAFETYLESLRKDADIKYSGDAK